jgi:hypothetical protein
LSVPMTRVRSKARDVDPEAEGRLSLPSSVGSTLVAITFLGTCVGLVWSMASPQGQFFLFGMLASLVVTIPIARPGYGVLGPWSLLALVVYVSCGFRGLFIALGLNGRLSIDDLFLLGHFPGYFTRPSALYVLALGLMVIGHMWHPRRAPGALVRKLSSFRFPPMIGAVAIFLALVGFVGFLLYAQRTGGLSAGLSMKRTTINGLDLASTYRSHGELRLLNGFSAIAFWLHVARHALRTGPGNVGNRLLGYTLFVNAVLLPIYASSRSEVAYIALVAFAIHYGVAGRFPRGRTLLRWGGIGVLALAAMTGSRLASQGTHHVQVTAQQALIDSVGEVLVYNRNFGDMQTTAHVIHAVPNLLPLQHGKTITAWLAAPIPRAVWPEKPLLQSGPVIGATIYGNARSGVPPGFVGEMYWNFAVPGVLFGSILLGLVMAYVRDTFMPYLRGSPVVGLFYGIGLMRLGAYVFAGGVGSGVFRLMTDLACLVAALVLTRVMGSAGAERRFHAVGANAR